MNDRAMFTIAARIIGLLLILWAVESAISIVISISLAGQSHIDFSSAVGLSFVAFAWRMIAGIYLLHGARHVVNVVFAPNIDRCLQCGYDFVITQTPMEPGGKCPKCGTPRR